MKATLRFWTFIALIWLVATGIDRLWWNAYQGLPSWDQADYLNSALDHGRALGLMHGAKWQGWESLLDLSPKIPPLASLVNGTIMAIAGDTPKQAAWSLSIWHGLLLFSVASWGLQLRGQSLALIGAICVAIAPGLLALRSDYVLEMPLTAVVTLSLWRLGCWLHPRQGGKWIQAIIAATCCTISLLTKQSSLLVLIPALILVGFQTLRNHDATKKQLFSGLGIAILGITPWLHHNWITTIGGTNRAVFESAKIEGDPSSLTIENWIWYARLVPKQIGLVILIIGVSGIILWAIRHIFRLNSSTRISISNDDTFAWKWLIFTLLLGWLFTSLSPNKGDRYITPLLPSLLLILSRGWLEFGLWAKRHWPKASLLYLPVALVAGLCSSIPSTWSTQLSLLQRDKMGPLAKIVESAGGSNPTNPPTTLIVVPSTPDLNQHNVSYFGRMQGGNLVGRQLGSSLKDIEPLLTYAEWVVLAEGEQGSVRQSAATLDQAIRNSGIFAEIKRFPRHNGDSYSLWRRKPNKQTQEDFANKFPTLANGLGDGLHGLKIVFDEIAIHHMLDGHFQYQQVVKQKASQELISNPNNVEARWSLALLALLTNRPDHASQQFHALQELLPNNPWPAIYHTLVSLADWNPWKAASIASKAQSKFQHPILNGMRDLSGMLGGAVWRLPSSTQSIPTALKEIEKGFNTLPKRESNS